MKMKTHEFYLQTLCFNDGKQQFIPYIERYCAMSAEEVEDEYFQIVADNFIETDFDKPTLIDKIKSFLSNIKPSSREKKNWRNAFLYFYAESNKQSENIFERMGLPKSGVRNDECSSRF